MQISGKQNTISQSTKQKRFLKYFSILFGVVLTIFCGSFYVKYVYASYITNPPNENAQQWKLNDNASNTTVLGNNGLNGTLVGGNTADVSSTINGYPAFHLNGSTQYISSALSPLMRTDEIANLWTKYSGNPVLGSTPADLISFGQLAKNPTGGWYFFGLYQMNVYRWESSDLIHWTNQVEVLPASALGAWDSQLDVANVFQKPNGTWVMLYRGRILNDSTYHVGLATSVDGTTFIRKNNGGVNDGLFPQFGNNYDPTGVILVGTTYYVYLNGDGGHQVTNVYYSTDDFNTFTANPNNPVFINAFCGTVWNYNGYYYILIPRDTGSGSTLYSHGIALYRSTSPLFGTSTRDYLGYVAINDQSYDNFYLDTPTVPMTDVYRTTYAPEFGNTFYMMYSGSHNSVSQITQNLAFTTPAELSSRTPIAESPSETNYNISKKTFSFWTQFDTLTDGDPVFSIGSSPTDSSPVWLGVIKTSGANKVLSFFIGGGYRNTSLPLTINTPYHIVVVDSVTDKKVYINDSLVGTFTQQIANTDASYLYIGDGYNGTRFLDGYVWDFRIYPKDLSAPEVAALYTTGSIDITAPVTTDNINTDLHNTPVTVTLTCTDTSGSGCATTYHTTDGTNPTTSSPSGTSFTLSADGTYTIKYFSVDAIGNQEAIKTATNQVKIYSVLPTVSISTPTAGIVHGSISATATAGATSPATISSVQFKLDGVNLQSAVTSSPYTITWDTTTATNASHTLTAVATDNYTNTTTSAGVSATVDNLGPTGSISNGNGSPTNSVTPTLNLTIADAGIGITGASMRFSCDSVTWSTWEAYATPKTNFNVKTGAGCVNSDGSKTVYVEYKDSLGNIGSSYNTGAFTLDTSASFATLSGTPASITKSTSASVTVAGTNIVSYEYKLDSGSYGIETVIATPISLSGLADGTHTISVIGKNSAGTWQLQGSATTYTWTVDTTAPVVTFSIPTTSNSLTLPFTSFSATDVNGVTGYLVNESATAPDVSDAGWSGTAQTQYVFSTEGAKTLYAWAKDGVGKISTSGSGAVTITLPVPAVSHGGGGCINCWVPPSVPTGGFNISINQNVSTTPNRIVTLNFNAKSDIKKIAISMTGDFNDASQENYSATRQWDLCSKFGGLIINPTCPNGKYIVYAKFYTASGIASPVASSSITLTTGATNTTTPTPAKYNFTRNLSLHATGADVKALQQYLNSHGFVISKTGAGSLGKETTLFGTLTYKSLVKFQKSLGWSGTGFFGPMTRDYINKQ